MRKTDLSLLVRMMARGLVAACAVAIALAASGCEQTAGTPDLAVKKFYQALVDKNYGAAYDLLTEAKRKGLEAELEALAKPDSAELARYNKALKLNLTTANVAAMSPREFFATSMEKARAQDAELARMLARAPEVAPPSAAASGQDKADVQVTLSTGRVEIIHCERDGGGWRVNYAP